MLVKCQTRRQRGCGISIPGGTQNSNGEVPEQPALMDLLRAVAWTRDLQMPLLPHSDLRFSTVAAPLLLTSPTFPHTLRLVPSLRTLLTPREPMCSCTTETHWHTDRKHLVN